MLFDVTRLPGAMVTSTNYCYIPFLSHHSEKKKEEMFILTMHSTHFIYGYVPSDK